MKPSTQNLFLLLSIVGIVIGIVLIELNGGVQNRIIYAPLALVTFLNVVLRIRRVAQKRSP
jgi:hypothetical protein